MTLSTNLLNFIYPTDGEGTSDDCTGCGKGTCSGDGTDCSNGSGYGMDCDCVGIEDFDCSRSKALVVGCFYCSRSKSLVIGAVGSADKADNTDYTISRRVAQP